MAYKKADSSALRCAGLMGHPYACVCGPDENRRLHGEANTLTLARTIAGDDTTRAIYLRTKRNWVLVK